MIKSDLSSCLSYCESVVLCRGAVVLCCEFAVLCFGSVVVILSAAKNLVGTKITAAQLGNHRKDSSVISFPQNDINEQIPIYRAVGIIENRL